MLEMSITQMVLSPSCNSLEEATLLLRFTSEKLLEFFQATSMKKKEKNLQIQELTSKREEERKQSQNLALKYNEIVTQHNAQLNRAKILQDEKDNLEKEKFRLAKVFPYRNFLP